MAYFDQIDPINDQRYVHKPDWNNFYIFLEKNFFDHFHQILTYDVILGQNDPILAIFTKNDLSWPNWPH